MLKKICVLMTLLMWLMINPGYAQGITIVVAPESRVEGSFITLGQLAQISGDDDGLVKKLAQLKLGNAPFPGSSAVLTRELFNMRLSTAGLDLSDIAWTIPNTITVTTSSQSISGQTLSDKAIATAKEYIGAKHANNDIVITPSGSVQDLLTPMGKIDLKATLPYGIRYNMPTLVMVNVSVDGKMFSKVPLKIDIKQYLQVLVVADPVNITDKFTNKNLRYERMDSSKIGASYFTDMDKVIGMAARRSLQTGIVITDSVLMKPILIKQGATVNIVARIGGMEVSAGGQSIQEGIEGQLIRVKNLNSNKIITAKVIDESTVQVVTYKSNG